MLHTVSSVYPPLGYIKNSLGVSPGPSGFSKGVAGL